MSDHTCWLCRRNIEEITFFRDDLRKTYDVAIAEAEKELESAVEVQQRRYAGLVREIQTLDKEHRQFMLSTLRSEVDAFRAVIPNVAAILEEAINAHIEHEDVTLQSILDMANAIRTNITSQSLGSRIENLKLERYKQQNEKKVFRKVKIPLGSLGQVAQSAIRPIEYTIEVCVICNEILESIIRPHIDDINRRI